MQRITLTTLITSVLAFAAAAYGGGGGGGGFTIDWFSVNGGGGTITGSDYEITSSIGQSSAGGPIVGSGFELTSGFQVVAASSPPCAADIDGDNLVGFADLLLILNAWDTLGGPEDLDGDGTVGFGDLLTVLSQWGPCP